MLIKHYAANSFIILPREKNMKFMMRNALTLEDAKKVVMALSVDDYSKGPCADDSDLGRNDVWVFGKKLIIEDKQVEVYIKTVVSKGEDGLGCLCISFHESEQPIAYVYGGAGNEAYVLS